VKAESKFQFAVKENEKLKANFATERASFETEKSNLIKRAEDAEAQLKPVAEELAGLKGHITHMTAAIFGKIHIQFKLCCDIMLSRQAILNLCCVNL
jgi:hypothetical protein